MCLHTHTVIFFYKDLQITAMTGTFRYGSQVEMEDNDI